VVSYAASGAFLSYWALWAGLKYPAQAVADRANQFDGETRENALQILALDDQSNTVKTDVTKLKTEQRKNIVEGDAYSNDNKKTLGILKDQKKDLENKLRDLKTSADQRPALIQQYSDLSQ
jgi:hypothetical protein